MNFVCGFAFNPGMTGVVLLLKQKYPPEIVGKWNGVGGRIEEGETSYEAMAREFKEEAGVLTLPTAWKHFYTARYANGNECRMLTTKLPQAKFAEIFSADKETVAAIPVASVAMATSEDLWAMRGSLAQTEYYAPLGYLLPMARLALIDPEEMQSVLL